MDDNSSQISSTSASTTAAAAKKSAAKGKRKSRAATPAAPKTVANASARKKKKPTAAASVDAKPKTDAPPPSITEKDKEEAPKETAKEEEQDGGDFAGEDDDMALDPEYEKYLRNRNEEATQQMRQLLEIMSPAQLTRYETYRSAAFPKGAMKKILQNVMGQNVPERLAVMVAGVVKLHLGQLVETSRQVMNERGETGAIRPEHLREADRRLSTDDTGTSSSSIAAPSMRSKYGKMLL